MVFALGSGLAFWMLPFTAAKLAGDCIETMASAQSVIGARMPIISAALNNPLAADHGELTRMVTEKTRAFGQSQRSIAAAHDKMRLASEANARTLGRISVGGWSSWSEWARLVAGNLEIATKLAMLPTAALAPIHSKAVANARRLRR